MKYFVPVLLSTLFLLPNLTQAQVTPTDALQQLSQNVDIGVNPENPGPNTNVTVSIDSYATDLNSAKIIWTVGGKTLQSGIGQKSLTLTTGALGTTLTINISIQPSDGTAAFQKTVVITPTGLDLFWQADSYTPPFYEGRSLFTKQGAITFVAIPNIIDANGNTMSPKNMIYTWSENNSVLGSMSGTGKNTLTLTDTILGLPMNISVSASTLDNTFTATGSISLQSQSPFILFYENNPLYGVLYNQELGDTFSLSVPEITITGTPYFFSNDDESTGSLKYVWSLNGATVDSPNQSYITLRQQQNATGNSILGLMINNQNAILQTAQKETTIQFGNQTTTL